MFDWSLKTSDTLLRAQNPCPTGSDTYTHTWSDASTSTFLLYGYEQLEDDVGDDDLLCESNETCIWMPNLGAYQGHGSLVSAATSGCSDIGTGGTLSNITLLRYESNGK